MQGGVGIVGARRNDEADPKPVEVSGEFRDALVLALRQAVLDRDVEPLDPAERPQPLLQDLESRRGSMRKLEQRRF
jgi:hypothetical protein